MATINDIYEGKLDAADEIYGASAAKFIQSFVIPPEVNMESLLNGEKYFVSGYKGVGKTSVLGYLQYQAKQNDPRTCTSFIRFKGYEEIRRSAMEAAAQRLTALIDVSGEIQPDKVEYLHIWRWAFFQQIVKDETSAHPYHLFTHDKTWEDFVKEVGRISFNSSQQNVLSLSSLRLRLQASAQSGFSAEAEANMSRVATSPEALLRLVEIADNCRELFQKLTRTDVPYYIFVDEMEAFYRDKDRFERDLTLIRDMIRVVHEFNNSGKVRMIAAIRNEIIYAINNFIEATELNRTIGSFEAPIRWSYSNTNSISHPIIKVLMKRIEMAGGRRAFHDWFPENVGRASTVDYILNNGWNKPRDIVRFLTAAKRDSLHCHESFFSQAVFETLRPEYSRESLEEVRLELNALYSNNEISMILKPFSGGHRFFTVEELRRRIRQVAPDEGSPLREFWANRENGILEDLYRVGFLGNVNRIDGHRRTWRWYHKGASGVLTNSNWELTIHNALFNVLSIIPD